LLRKEQRDKLQARKNLKSIAIGGGPRAAKSKAWIEQEKDKLQAR